MKLRNKETGEIGNLKPYGEDERIWIWVDNLSSPEYRYDSLAELNDEWEDYEEPKGYWFIDTYSYEVSYLEERRNEDLDNFNKEIGNYFETKEEAEKAVEKLKAWKRLKDARFKFTDFEYDLDEESSSLISIDANVYFEMMAYEYFIDDLNLIFGDKQ